MNRSRIEGAIQRNLPFTLRTADGQEYHVPHRDYLSLPPGPAPAAMTLDFFPEASAGVGDSRWLDST